MGFSGGGSSSSIAGSTDAALSNPANGQVLMYNSTAGKWVNQSFSGSTNATTSSPGVIQLAGDLAGTGLAPTVPGLATKAPLSSPTFTGSVTVPAPVDSTDASTKGYVDGLTGVFAPDPGTVNLDSFTGATDDDKLTAAFAYIQSQSSMPALQLPNRNVTFSQTRTPFSGMKILGASGPGPKNLELSSGQFVGPKVTLNCGSGSSSWMYYSQSGGYIYNIYIGNIAFQYGTGASFWYLPSGSAYACQFHSLTHYQATNVFGSATTAAYFTQANFSGHWEVEGGKDVQMRLGGSDNDFWVNGYLNIQGPTSTAGAGRYQMIFTSDKTNVGTVYCTSVSPSSGSQGWRGIQVLNKEIQFYHLRTEGANATTNGQVADGNVLNIQGGIVTVHGGWFAMGMANPAASEHGLIEVTAGTLNLIAPVYYRNASAMPNGTVVSASVPLIYASGGKVRVYMADSQAGETMYATQAGGTITCPDNTVTIN